MDLGGDNTPEWKETTKDFTVHVVNKTDVNISGLSNNETFTYDGNLKCQQEQLVLMQEQ